MNDIEFVKLRFWLDAELTMIRIMLAIVLGFEIHKQLVWWAVAVYVAFSLLYVAVRLNFVERKHQGYLRIPKI